MSAEQSLEIRAGRPKVLVVSYHFGKQGATGGFRWHAMIGHLVQYGWSFDVVTSESASSPAVAGLDPERVCIHQVVAPRWARGIEPFIHRVVSRVKRAGVGRRTSVDSMESAGIDEALVNRRQLVGGRSKAGELIANLSGAGSIVHDLAWARAATAYARRLSALHNYRAVIVSSPPHFTQYAGIALKEECGLPFIADYRDPWVAGLTNRFTDFVRRSLGARMERAVSRSADVVIHNTERALQIIGRELDAQQETPTRRVAIPNAYDQDEPVSRPDPKVFRVAFTGWLHPHMDLRPVFAACGRFARRHNLTPEQFRLELVGTDSQFHGIPLSALARLYDLEDHFDWTPRVSRLEANEIQQRAAVLIGFDYLHRLSVIMKFYDYAKMCGAMLLIGNPDGALADAAARLGVRVYEPTDAAGIDAALNNAHERWRKGLLTCPADANGYFNRQRQAERVNTLLASL